MFSYLSLQEVFNIDLEDILFIINNDDMKYVKNINDYFLRDSKNEKIEEIKKEIAKKNKKLFSCFAALTLNEDDFVTFYDKFDLDINSIETKTKVTPLLCSLLNNNHDVLKVILTKYKDTVNVYAKSANGLNPLHFLALKKNLAKDSEKMLLIYPNFPINAKDKNSLLTPLILAVKNNNYDLVSFLLKNPQIDFSATDLKQNNVFHFLFQYPKFFKMLKLFLDHSDPSQYLMKKNHYV